MAFATCVAVGGALAAAALPFQSVACLALSQIVMGVGKGTLTTAQKVFLRLACAPGEASFFFALSFSLTHLGTFLAFILAPLVEAASPLDYKAGVYTSAGITLACLLLTLPLLGRLDHILPFLRHDGDVDSSAGNSVCSAAELLGRDESEGSLASVPGAAGWEEDLLLPEQRPRQQPDTASTAAESTASSTATTGGAAEEREGHAFPLSRSASTLEEEEAAAAPMAMAEAPVRPDAAGVVEAAPARRWWACGCWGEAGGMFHPADLCTAAFGLLLLSNLVRSPLAMA